LTDLSISNNNIQTLPESFGNLTALTYLYLCNNNIQTLPESIGKLTTLTYLDVRGNKDLARDKKSCKMLASLRQREPACKVRCDRDVEDEIRKILDSKE
jgi:Leucine-rich repeat (LRR) protein